ncbi:MAG: flagellar export chaperone FliS [Deltaproteobacteria bacterium]|nr:flagellar export chaperone FliS [Deltaproteobacteria bacterium]
MYQKVVNIYQQSNITTANPAKLVIMCYEGAVSSLKLARDAYAAKDYGTKGKALQKAIDFINELNASLDMPKGGHIAVNLRALYMYMTQALTEADLKKDLKTFDDVIRMLEELESAWKAISTPPQRTDDAKPQQSGISPYGVARQTMSAQAWNA